MHNEPSFSEQPIKAIIFDCDGTLVDSEEAHFLACRQALQNRGYDLTLKQYAVHTGKPALAVVKALSESINCAFTDEFLAEIKAYSRELRKQGSPAIEPNVNFVKRLASEKERLNLKLGVASAATKAEILSNLRHLGIEKVFDIVLSGHEDLGSYSDREGVNKPKPYIYLHAAKLLNIAPSECVVIEDSLTGIISGSSAGCITIAIPNRFTEKQDLSVASLRLKTLSGISVDQFLQMILSLKVREFP